MSTWQYILSYDLQCASTSCSNTILAALTKKFMYSTARSGLPCSSINLASTSIDRSILNECFWGAVHCADKGRGRTYVRHSSGFECNVSSLLHTFAFWATSFETIDAKSVAHVIMSLIVIITSFMIMTNCATRPFFSIMYLP